MNNIIKLIYLDFMSIKNYFSLKNMIILIGILVFMSIAGETPIFCISYSIVMGNIYASYAFALSESCDLNVLYQTLPFKRKDVVIGRYVFNLMILTVFGLFGFLGGYLYVSLIAKTDVSFIELSTSFLSVLIVFWFVQIIQISILFKLGYSKAKVLTYLPFLIIMVIGFVASKYLNFGNIISVLNENIRFIIVGCVVIFIVGIIGSIMYSINAYKSRDF